MASIQELNDKVDALQSSLDNEQVQIQAAIDGLAAEVARLNDIISQGATPEALQAVADKIDAIKSDLEGTVV